MDVPLINSTNSNDFDTEKKLRDERNRYLFLYNRTNERFLAFEQKQIEKVRRIFDFFASTTENDKCPIDLLDDVEERRRLSSSLLLPSSFNHPLEQFDKTNENFLDETRWDQLTSQIDELMSRAEQIAEQYRENSLIRIRCENERKLRRQIEDELEKTKQIIEQDRSKRLQKLRNYATLADDEGDILLSSLMKKAEKNDVDFRELKVRFENVLFEQIEQMKKLVKERELHRLYIQRLESENAMLGSLEVPTHLSRNPIDFQEASILIDELREEILRQMKFKEKFRHDFEQNEQNYQLDLREREQIEELLNRDLTAANDEISVLKSFQNEYERLIIVKTDLEKQCEELNSFKIDSTTLIEKLTQEKNALIDENLILRAQVQKLRIDFENSELVQHDFVKLSQQLQMQLEEIRTSENELRWQPEEDFNECQHCRTPFSVTVRRHRCRHCGKVMCKECTSKIVYTGPNHRPSRVCDVCYTLLVKDSQPFFLTGVQKF